MYTNLSHKIIYNHRQTICPICGTIEKFLTRYVLTIEFDICSECSYLRSQHRASMMDRIFHTDWNSLMFELESWLGVPMYYVTAETVPNRIKLSGPAECDRLVMVDDEFASESVMR